MTSSQQTIGCCLSTYSSLLHLALIKNGSQLQTCQPSLSPLSLFLFWSRYENPCSASSRPCRLHWSPIQIASSADSSYRHGHNILFLLPDLFHIIHRHDVGANRLHGILFICHPVSVTVQSSIPYTFSGNRQQNKGSPSLSPSMRTSASLCGSTHNRTLALSCCRRSGYAECWRPLGFVKHYVAQILGLALRGRRDLRTCISEQRSAGRVIFHPTPLRYRQSSLDVCPHALALNINAISINEDVL